MARTVSARSKVLKKANAKRFHPYARRVRKPTPTLKQSHLSPTRGQVRIVRQPPKRWTQMNEKRLVAVLSCDPSRQDMLSKALAYWESVNAKVLLFVPEQHTTHFERTHANANVRLVSYTMNDPAHMFVGHSRNAVLQFCRLHLDVLRTMVVADERVYALNEWALNMEHAWRSTPSERFF